MYDKIRILFNPKKLMDIDLRYVKRYQIFPSSTKKDPILEGAKKIQYTYALQFLTIVHSCLQINNLTLVEVDDLYRMLIALNKDYQEHRLSYEKWYLTTHGILDLSIIFEDSIKNLETLLAHPLSQELSFDGKNNIPRLVRFYSPKDDIASLLKQRIYALEPNQKLLEVNIPLSNDFLNSIPKLRNELIGELASDEGLRFLYPQRNIEGLWRLYKKDMLRGNGTLPIFYNGRHIFVSDWCDLTPENISVEKDKPMLPLLDAEEFSVPEKFKDLDAKLNFLKTRSPMDLLRLHVFKNLNQRGCLDYISFLPEMILEADPTLNLGLANSFWNIEYQGRAALNCSVICHLEDPEKVEDVELDLDSDSEDDYHAAASRPPMTAPSLQPVKKSTHTKNIFIKLSWTIVVDSDLSSLKMQNVLLSMQTSDPQLRNILEKVAKSISAISRSGTSVSSQSATPLSSGRPTPDSSGSATPPASRPSTPSSVSRPPTPP